MISSTGVDQDGKDFMGKGIVDFRMERRITIYGAEVVIVLDVG